MDLLDIVQEQEDFMLQVKLGSRKQFTGESLTHCVDCEEPIEEARRKVLKGVQLCVDCASLKERRINKLM